MEHPSPTANRLPDPPRNNSARFLAPRGRSRIHRGTIPKALPLCRSKPNAPRNNTLPNRGQCAGAERPGNQRGSGPGRLEFRGRRSFAWKVGGKLGNDKYGKVAAAPDLRGARNWSALHRRFVCRHIFNEALRKGEKSNTRRISRFIQILQKARNQVWRKTNAMIHHPLNQRANGLDRAETFSPGQDRERANDRHPNPFGEPTSRAVIDQGSRIGVGGKSQHLQFSSAEIRRWDNRKTESGHRLHSNPRSRADFSQNRRRLLPVASLQLAQDGEGYSYRRKDATQDIKPLNCGEGDQQRGVSDDGGHANEKPRRNENSQLSILDFSFSPQNSSYSFPYT